MATNPSYLLSGG